MPKSKAHPKRVHFSENCLTFAPITPGFSSPEHARTPSPTLSDHSSSSSSPDPPTPPPVQYIPSPYPYAQVALVAVSPPSSTTFPTPTPSLIMGLPTPTPSPPGSVTGKEPQHHHHHHQYHHHQHHQHHQHHRHQQYQPMNVHHLLAFSPSSISPLLYNLINAPSTQHLSKQSHRPVYELHEPATNPPLPQMIITSSSVLPEQWQIKVIPASQRTELAGMFSPASTTGPFSPALGGTSPPDAGFGAVGAGAGYVTVFDVLLALYSSLRTIVHPTEYERLTRAPRSPTHAKDSVTGAFWARLGHVSDPKKKEEQKRKGVRRIDFVGRNTTFLGLTGTLKSNVWELELGEMPLPPLPPHQGDQQ